MLLVFLQKEGLTKHTAMIPAQKKKKEVTGPKKWLRFQSEYPFLSSGFGGVYNLWRKIEIKMIQCMNYYFL